MKFYLKVFKVKCTKCHSIAEVLVQRFYLSLNQIRRNGFEKQNILSVFCGNCGLTKKVDENIINSISTKL